LYIAFLTIKGEKEMECPECKKVFGDLLMVMIGQSMCPACGNILEYTDIISNEHYEEEKDDKQ
jgi:hypothetical protein